MADGSAGGGEGGGNAELAERAAWERLMVKLVALRGDPDTEAFLEEKHKELLMCAVPLDEASGEPPAAPDGTSFAEAMEAWFKRKLRGQSGDTRERRKLCKGVEKALRKQAEKYESPAEGAPSACDVLKEGGAVEGPVICHMLARGLVGTRFQGMRIARVRDGVYQLGAIARVAVQADLEGGALLVHGHYDESGVLHPARVPVRAFLEDHESKPASDQCDMFGSGAAAAAAAVAAAVDGSSDPAGAAAKAGGEEESQSKKHRELPPGWAKRESRSKPGVFYYVHEAKGLSQFDRPVE